MKRIDRWFFPQMDPRRIAVLRIAFSTLLLLRLLQGDFVRLSRQPDELFRPLGLLRILDGMPPTPLVFTIQAFAILGAILAIVGVWARPALAVTWASSLLLHGMLTSSGKILHNDVLLLLAAAPLVLARHDEAWTFRRRAATRPTNGFPVRAAMVIVAAAYFFAGYSKLMSSGLAWVFSGNMRWILYASSDNQATPNAVGLFIADRPWMATVAAAGIVLLEIGFPLVLVSRAARPLFVAGAVMFSVGIGITLHLNYMVWAAVVLVVFVDWPAVIDRSRARTGASRAEGVAPA